MATQYFKRSLLLNLSPVLLPGKSHGQRNLVGFSPWGREESDTTEWLHFHFSLSCIGEGNGNPLQCCLENPRDSRAWWAAIYGVTQSWTRLKRLSSSSSRLQILKEVSLKILCCHNDTWFHLKLTIFKPGVNQCIFLVEMFVLSYVSVLCNYPKLCLQVPSA